MAETDNRGEQVAEALFPDQEMPFAAYFEREQFPPNLGGAFEAAEGIFISDVTDHAMRFYSQAAVFEEMGEKMPCVSMRDFEYAPIEVFSSSLPFLERHYFYPEFHYFWHRAVRRSRYLENLAGGEEQVRYFSPREALGFIRRGVARFLDSRFSSAKQLPSLAPVPFTLHNQNPNHQIYFSSPYYLVDNNVFGGPSTPVTQHLYPGIYIFGVMGPVVHNNHRPQFEKASQFDIPRLHISGTLVTI